jgi:hypothetical protein
LKDGAKANHKQESSSVLGELFSLFFLVNKKFLEKFKKSGVKSLLF